MAFHAEAMSEQKRNPISTLDDAVMWLASVGAHVIFFEDSHMRLYVTIGAKYFVERLLGEGGFDARGTLMMATRELWEMVNA